MNFCFTDEVGGEIVSAAGTGSEAAELGVLSSALKIETFNDYVLASNGITNGQVEFYRTRFSFSFTPQSDITAKGAAFNFSAAVNDISERVMAATVLDAKGDYLRRPVEDRPLERVIMESSGIVAGVSIFGEGAVAAPEPASSNYLILFLAGGAALFFVKKSTVESTK
jgi:hypothetical protein